MADEFTEVLHEDENFDMVEEDYIIEEIDISSADIKQEYDPHEDEGDALSDEYRHIVCLQNDESTEQAIYNCELCNTTFTSITDHLKERHNRDTVEHYDENNEIGVKQEEEVIAILDPNQEDSNEAAEGGDVKKIVISSDYVYDRVDEMESYQSEALDLNDSLMCNDCKTLFDNENELKEHQCQLIIMREEPITTLFSCPECPEKFSLINLLRKHQKMHKVKKIPKKTKHDGLTKNSDTEKHNCDICNTIFSSSKNLKLHSKMHLAIPTKTIRDAMPNGAEGMSEKNQFYCEICNKSFDHTLLNVHQNMHQNIEEHNCSICNRQFENEVSYDMHMQLHADQPTRVRPQQVAKPGAKYPCNYCGREFLRPHEKVKHERIHTGEKPYECEVCGKSFRVSYSLTLHLRTHTDVRPFVCTQCNKRFKSYAVYSHHLNTHSEERPYKCPMCPKSFRTSVQLCGHKNSHTKPYSCPECNRPFASLYAVKMHMKTHNKANKSNENLKHRCGICGAVYARMFALRYHMQEQHSADITHVREVDIGENSKLPVTADDSFNEDEVSTQAILQCEEIIIDNFHTEEIVTDWLTNK